MKAIRVIVAGALMTTGAATLAQVDTGQPKDATGVCKDGTFYTGKDREAACRANGGLQEWWGTGAPKKSAPDAGKVTEAKKDPGADPREPYDKAQHPQPAVPPASDKR